MTRRTKIMTLLVLLILVLLFGVAFLLLTFRPRTQEENLQVASTNQQEQQPVRSEADVEGESVRAEELSLRALAKTFAERQGSFSNESHFQNVRDLFGFMTPELMQASRASMEAATASNEAYSMITRVITTEIELDEQEGKAQVLLTTQREEISKGASKIFYQPLEMRFEKQQGLWKVASFQWQAE